MSKIKIWDASIATAISIVVFLLCTLAIFWLPQWLYEEYPFYKYKDIGQIGDSIGGIAGPIVALIAATLTFWAFRVQYDANQQQKVDLAKERFENKFFEMLKLHKENLNEMNIEGYDVQVTNKKTYHDNEISPIIEHSEQQISKYFSGRYIFNVTYDELVSCYKICEFTLRTYSIENKKKYLIKLSYKLFFYGIDDELLISCDKKITDDESYVKYCKISLRKARLEHIETCGSNNYYQIPNSDFAVRISIKYKPFSGHSDKLSHYYRHLYMMAKFIDSNSSGLISVKEKHEYFRIMRSQLNTFEQLMLYFNYLSGIGGNWENNRNHFFSEYCLIKNIPISLTKFAIDPLEEFKELIEKCNEKGKRMINDSKY